MIIKTESNGTLEAIGKMITLTRADKMQWRAAEKKLFPPFYDGERIGTVFISDYLDTTIRIYEKYYSKKVPKQTARYNNPLLFGFSGISSADTEYISIPTREVMLEIIDSNGDSLWTFPTENILNDLLMSIKYKVSGAQDFMDKLLQQ